MWKTAGSIQMCLIIYVGQTSFTFHFVTPLRRNHSWRLIFVFLIFIPHIYILPDPIYWSWQYSYEVDISMCKEHGWNQTRPCEAPGHKCFSVSLSLNSKVQKCVKLLAVSIVCDSLSLVACQAPLVFFRQEYWSGWPCPSPGDLPDPGIEPMSPALQADSLLSELRGKQNGRSQWIWEARGCRLKGGVVQKQ